MESMFLHDGLSLEPILNYILDLLMNSMFHYYKVF